MGLIPPTQSASREVIQNVLNHLKSTGHSVVIQNFISKGVALHFECSCGATWEIRQDTLEADHMECLLKVSGQEALNQILNTLGQDGFRNSTIRTRFERDPLGEDDA